MSTEVPQSDSTSVPLRWQIDRICDQFEWDWQSGTIPSISDYLDRISSGSRLELLEELVTLDLGYRWNGPQQDPQPDGSSRGQFPTRPRLDDYVAAFPELGSLQQLPLHVIREEIDVCSRFGNHFSETEYARRYAGHPRLPSILAASSTPRVTPTTRVRPRKRKGTGIQKKRDRHQLDQNS